MDDKDKKETDTHFRCSNGKASFNYRLLYNVKAPRQKYDLVIQSWDKDLFKSNDFIGEATVNIKELFEDAILTKKPIALNKKYFNGFFKEKHPEIKLQFYDDDSFYVETKNKDGKYVGKVRVQVEVMPGEMAKSNPVGAARGDPNQSPFLPPPVGRISFTLNPFKMLFQMVGPAVQRKIILYCCLITCLMLCLFCIPLVFSQMIANGISKIF